MKTVKAWSTGFLLVGLIFRGDSFGAAANTPQTNSGGGITAKVTYLNPGSTEDLRFQVVFATHSVNLFYFAFKMSRIMAEWRHGKTTAD